MPTDSSSRLALTWAAIRDSLWFAPALATLGGIVLALVAIRVPPPADGSVIADWVFGGGAEGARGVLSTIAGSLITVTGVVFSVTIVALQLASSQFTPRVLGSFVADRVNQVVLGIFIGTFTYTLLVLRTIRSEADDRQVFVPYVAVTIALLLLLLSIGALIVYINHAARSIQASTILHRETQRTIERINQLFPARVGEPVAHEEGEVTRLPAEVPAIVTAAEAGYLQAVHAESLWTLAEGRSHTPPLILRMELHVGAFAFPGRALAAVWPAEACDERVERAVRDAFVLGIERTPEQDVELGLVELSDIAVRALSPGINDPTTATHAVDRLSELLVMLATRHHPDTVRASEDGRVRLLVKDTPFERAVGLAFDQIRHFGAGNPAIAKKLLEVLRDLALIVPAPLRAPLAAQADSVHRAARRAIDDPSDLATVDRLAAETQAATHASAIALADAGAAAVRHG